MILGHDFRRISRLALRCGDVVVIENADEASLLVRDVVRNHIYRLAAERKVENVGVLFLPGKLRVRKMPKRVRLAK